MLYCERADIKQGPVIHACAADGDNQHRENSYQHRRRNSVALHMLSRTDSIAAKNIAAVGFIGVHRRSRRGMWETRGRKPVSDRPQLKASLLQVFATQDASTAVLGGLDEPHCRRYNCSARRCQGEICIYLHSLQQRAGGPRKSFSTLYQNLQVVSG